MNIGTSSHQGDGLISTILNGNSRVLKEILKLPKAQGSQKGIKIIFGMNKESNTTEITISSNTISSFVTIKSLEELQDFLFENIELLQQMVGDIDDIQSKADCYRFFINFIIPEILYGSSIGVQRMQKVIQDHEDSVRKILAYRKKITIKTEEKNPRDRKIKQMSPDQMGAIMMGGIGDKK